MEIYLAGPNLKIIQEFYERSKLKPNILISYNDAKGKVEETVDSYRPYCNKFMLDSGGFSSKKKLTKEESICLGNRFLNFLKEKKSFLDKTFTCVFAFDYIKGLIDFNKNTSRYEEQLSIYDNIVPVVHNINENSNEIENYKVYEPHTIAIGFSEDKTNIKYLKPATEKIRMFTKSHLLGVTDAKLLTEIKTDTSDSRSWSDYAETGEICYYYKDNYKARIERLYNPNIQNKERSGAKLFYESEYFDIVMEDVKKFGFTQEDLDNKNKEKLMKFVNIYYTMGLETILNEIQDTINKTTKINDNHGTN